MGMSQKKLCFINYTDITCSNNSYKFILQAFSSYRLVNKEVEFLFSISNTVKSLKLYRSDINTT